MARAPKLTPAQIRDRKARRLAIGLSVLLLSIVVFQAPKLMKMLNGSSTPTASPTAKTTGADALTATDLGGSVASSGSGRSAAGPSAQLYAFGQFGIKDPFHAQVGVVPAGGTADTGTLATVTTKGTAVTVKPGTPVVAPIPITQAPTQQVPFTVAPAAPPNAAVIMTNGKRQIVPVGGAFPTKQPLFTLVKLGKNKKLVRISVVGGSFENGDPTLALRRGKTLTLANQSDGSRYVVKLIKLTTTDVPAAAATTTTPAPGSLPVTP